MASMNYETIPIATPPPGVIPNFDDPETRAPAVIAIIVVCLALMWPIFILRLYTKIWINHSFGWDDVSSILATALTTTFAGAIIWIMGTLGPHGWDIRASSIIFVPRFSEIVVVIGELFYGPAIFFAKLSIFLLYLRTFFPSRWTRYLTYFGITFNLIVYSGTTIAFGVLCVRRPGETWLQVQMTRRCSYNTRAVGYIQGIFGVISDLFIFILPLPVIWGLQMPTKRKVGVIAIFATGLLAIVASILGLYYRIENAIGTDPFWDLPAAQLLAVVETSVGVICGCMPYLAAFFRRHRLKSSLAVSVRHLLARLTSRTSESRSTDIHLDDVDRKDSGSSEAKMYVETKVLGSIQGNGGFLKTTNFDTHSNSRMSGTMETPTNREAWERV